MTWLSSETPGFLPVCKSPPSLPDGLSPDRGWATAVSARGEPCSSDRLEAKSRFIVGPQCSVRPASRLVTFRERIMTPFFPQLLHGHPFLAS